MTESGPLLHQQPSGEINFTFETEWQWFINTDGPWTEGLHPKMKWVIYSYPTVSTSPTKALVFSIFMSPATAAIHVEVVGMPAENYRSSTVLECIRHCERVVQTEKEYQIKQKQHANTAFKKKRRLVTF